MYNYLKRRLDIFISIILIILFSPLFIFILIINKFQMSGSSFFIQKRPGLLGKPFKIYKFRTMNNKRDEKGNLLSDEERLTVFGRFLRSTSLDELPELFNVLKGDMSLVGPRPLLMQYLDRYSPEQARRHEVKPGITGWAQVNGRNAVSWEERFTMDVWYVDHMSFWLDVKILFLTVFKVFKKEGINQPGHSTVEYFQGNTNVKES